jgi:hypothetical protein
MAMMPCRYIIYGFVPNSVEGHRHRPTFQEKLIYDRRRIWFNSTYCHRFLERIMTRLCLQDIIYFEIWHGRKQLGRIQFDRKLKGPNGWWSRKIQTRTRRLTGGGTSKGRISNGRRKKGWKIVGRKWGILAFGRISMGRKASGPPIVRARFGPHALDSANFTV